MLAHQELNRRSLLTRQASSTQSGQSLTTRNHHNNAASFVGPQQYRFSQRSAAPGATLTNAANIFPATTPSSLSPASTNGRVRTEFVGLKSLSAPQLGRRAVGELSQADTVATATGDRRWDEYAFSSLKPGRQVHVRLNSDEFDPFLQVINGKTGRVLAENDNGSDRNSRITFKVKPGIDYRLHITSHNGAAMGEYEVETEQFNPKSMRNFSFDYGHGLIDAAAAVAEAAGIKRFKKGSTRWSDKVWGQNALNVSSVWKEGITGKGVTVAVLDTGIQTDHSELKGNLWRNSGEIPGNGKDDDGNGFIDDVRGWNFADDNADLSDHRDHGSHVAGIIGANENGDVKGIAHDVKLMPIKVVGASGGSQEHVAQGIRYAVKQGANVINLSLGADPGSLMDNRLKRAIRFAYRKDVTVVVASGNERQLLGATQPGEPANYTAQQSIGIVVGAVDQTHTVADFSNPTGNQRSAFVSAPGTNIFSLSSQEQSGYKWRQGTSMATGYVSGVVALMLSANPSLTPRKITRILTKTANRKTVAIA